MDAATIIALVVVAAAVAGAVLYLRGRGPRREPPDLLTRNPAARAVRTGEDSPGQSADAAAFGSRERRSVATGPAEDERRVSPSGPRDGKAPR